MWANTGAYCELSSGIWVEHKANCFWKGCFRVGYGKIRKRKEGFHSLEAEERSTVWPVIGGLEGVGGASGRYLRVSSGLIYAFAIVCTFLGVVLSTHWRGRTPVKVSSAGWKIRQMWVAAARQRHPGVKRLFGRPSRRRSCSQFSPRHLTRASGPGRNWPGNSEFQSPPSACGFKTAEIELACRGRPQSRPPQAPAMKPPNSLLKSLSPGYNKQEARPQNGEGLERGLVQRRSAC